MRGRCHSRRAFTLIEALVVVAILTLLLTLLMPVIWKARDLARRAVCIGVFRELGMATLGFAAGHDGRGPGCGGRWVHPDLPPSDPNRYYSGPAWWSVLNTEYYRDSRISSICYFRPTTRNRGRLVCPSVYRPSGFPPDYTYNYWVLMNNDAQGCDRGRPLRTTTGKMVPAPSQFYSSYSPRLTEYHWGTRLMMFQRPDWQILYNESESFGNATLLPSHAVEIFPLEADPIREGFLSSPGGHHVFRHLGTSVFTFLDGHADYLAPEERLDNRTRYYYRP